MNLENLKYFYEVANTKSISKTAAKSHISQSAISKQIQKLEEGLNVRLIDRSNKGIELTSAGEVVLKYAEKILQNYDRMEEAVQNFTMDNHVVKINACCVLNPYVMSKIVYVLKKKLSDLNFDVQSNSCDKIESDILEYNSHLGLVCKAPTDKDVISEKLATDRIILACSKDYKIPAIIDFQEILKYQIVLLNANNGTNETVRKRLINIGKKFSDLNVVFTADSTESVKASIVNGQGLAFLPYLVLKEEIDNGIIKEVKITDLDLSYNIYLIYNIKQDEKIKLVINEFKHYWNKQFNHINNFGIIKTP